MTVTAPAGTRGQAHQTLTGIRVVEVGSNIAGPLAAMILGDLGADVVKVEGPAAGDDTRAMPPVLDGESTVFRSFNRSKRSVAVDLASEAGRAAVLRLAGGADVVIQNLRPGTAERLGFGFDAVAARNPQTIYCSITAFGEGTVGTTLPGYDAMVQAFTGIMASTGWADDERPVRVSASLVDTSTAVWAALGILAALIRRPVFGGPQFVDPCLVDTALNLMSHQVSAHLATGALPPRLGAGAPSFVPYRTYRASDGWVFVAAGTDRLFAKLCAVLGTPGVAADIRFTSPESRVEHRDLLDTELDRQFAARPVSWWLEELALGGVPACRIQDLGQALAAPVTGERGLLIDGYLRLPIDNDRQCGYTAPPELGEHTEAVLREGGFSDQEIRALRPGSGDG